MGVLNTGMVVIAGLLSTPGAIQYLSPHDGWTIETKGPWQCRVDHRDLVAMQHPWTTSETGNFAMAWTDVTIPEDWGDTVYLHFYASDDYHGAPRDDMPGVGLVGHRRRQVLVDSRPVWTRDVSDPVQPGMSPQFRAPVPLSAGDRTVRITLLAYDVLASTRETKKDSYSPPKPGLTRESDPDAGKFRTTVFWGDLTLSTDVDPPTIRPRPAETLVLKHHNQFWPPEPDTERWTSAQPELEISAPAGVPDAGFPLTMGLPLPEGLVEEPGEFRLANQRGQAVYCQKRVTSTWPDGSLRWAAVQLPVTPKTGPVSLGFKKDYGRPSGKNTLKESNDAIKVDAGRVSLQAGALDPIGEIEYRGNAVVKRVRLALEVAGKSIPGTNDAWQVIEEGPFHTQLLFQGRFEGLEAAAGTYALYGSVYHGLPYVRLWLRYFNDTGKPLAISRMDVRFELPEALADVRLPHGEVSGPFSLQQTAPDGYVLDGEQHANNGPFFVQWNQGALAVRDFSVLHPKGITLDPEQLIVSLVAADGLPVTFTPGEAKSHEIWLAFGGGDGAQLAATVDRPPMLSNPGYFCESGVFGPAAPLPDGHPWRRFLAKTYGARSLPSLGMATGVRHYPDEPYLRKPDTWSNNYNGRMTSLWSAWLATGDRVWYDRAAAVCRHLMDTAVVHSEVPGKPWIGALHGPGPNHVAGPWNPMLRAEGLAWYGQLTGNPEAAPAFLGVADYCLRTGAGRVGPNVRHAAGPFSTIVAALRETGEIAMLEAGTERLTEMYTHVDRRRGTWIDWHASSTYPGNIPWMAAQLARPLYLWYRQTGDVEAAQLLVGLAESMVCENTPWDGPGAMRAYSPDPHFPDSAVYDPFIVPMLMAAHELTGDTFFLDAARAQYQRWSAAPTFQPVYNMSWHMPWLGKVTGGLAIAEEPPETEKAE